MENQPKKRNFLLCSMFMYDITFIEVSHTREGRYSFVCNEFEHVVVLSKPSPTKLSKREQEKE